MIEHAGSDALALPGGINHDLADLDTVFIEERGANDRSRLLGRKPVDKGRLGPKKYRSRLAGGFLPRARSRIRGQRGTLGSRVQGGLSVCYGGDGMGRRTTVMSVRPMGSVNWNLQVTVSTPAIGL